jgi:hypothetical protein
MPQPHPTYARVVVNKWHEKSGRVVNQPGRADWHEYIPTEDFMWREKPHVMIAKCAEAFALRKAFPWVLGDIYIPEEMARADSESLPPPAPVAARQAVAARAAAITASAGGGTAQDAPGADDEPPGAGVPADPLPDAGGPSAALLEPLTREEFGARLSAHGISRTIARAASESLFPGKPSAELTADEWGRLWQRVSGDPIPVPSDA